MHASSEGSTVGEERIHRWISLIRTLEHVTVQRMDHVGVVVDDLAGATEFFVALGLELQGDGAVGWTGSWGSRACRWTSR